MNQAPTLLVVDDDTTTRMVVGRVLANAGYHVIETDNGRTALELFRSARPVLVLMDVMMPVMDGFDACREMRRESEFVSTPILLLTALDDAASIAAAFEAGATDFITKPVNPTLVTERVRYSLRARQMAEQLKTSQSRLIEVQRIAQVAYWEYDADRDQLTWSDDVELALKVTGAAGDRSLAAFLAQLHDSDRTAVHGALGECLRGEGTFGAEFRLAGGADEERLFYARGELHRDAQRGVGVVVGSVQDITELRSLERRLEFLANNDALTGLPNRQSYHELLRLAMADGVHHDVRVAVLILDIDNFKAFNDTLGPEQSDVLLRAVADRLSEMGGPHRHVARLGGDEFGLILGQLGHPAEAARAAQGAIDRLAVPFSVAGRELFMTASVGVSVYPDDGGDVDSLIKHADAALNRAKSSGRNTFRYFTVDMNRRAAERLALETSLHRALERNELRMVYQPQVEVGSGRPLGFEALMRWDSPEHGRVPPATFIPILEEIGLIKQIGAWSLREACRQCLAWSGNGRGPLLMSVNLSGRQFELSDLVDTVGLVLGETGLDPHLLELEITENILMQDTESTLATLRALKASGIRIAVDDFGTGYSSLVYLKRLPLDVLKVDRSFVLDLSRYDDSVIVRSTIDLAHNLGLEVVAEGVETEEASRLLEGMGCDRAQGYFFGLPMTVAECSDWLRGAPGSASAGDDTVTQRMVISDPLPPRAGPRGTD